MKSLITLLLIVLSTLLCAVSQTFGAIVSQEQTLVIGFTFTPPAEVQGQITGYSLQKDGEEICTVGIAEVTTSSPDSYLFDCKFFTEDGTFDFTLSASYDDGSASSLSQPFSYTIDSASPGSEPAGDPAGSKIVTYQWSVVDPSVISSFRMYMNEDLLCETDVDSASSLECRANLINAKMAFAVSAVDTDGVESERSNILILDPEDFPELFVKKRLTFDFAYQDSTTSAGGFKVYNNTVFLCSSPDPTIRQISCEGDLVSGENSFTIHAVDLYGVETLASTAVVYQNDTTSGPGTTPPDEQMLSAQFTSSTTSGEAPLLVTFDASNSTGGISEYSWDFGDGESGGTTVVQHTFQNEGTYKVTLTVTDDSSQNDVKEVSISVLPPTTELQQPTAIISSTTAAGDAPLEVEFSGAGSQIYHPPATYLWDFGDGNQLSGEVVSYTYTTAGIYYAQLTVSDQSGLSDSVDTPVLVTSTAPANQLPEARFTVSPTIGECPLTVQLDGSSSSDADGNIVGYDWNLGDGSNRNGSKISYTYNTPASYSITLQVTDNDGGVSDMVQTVSCTDEPEQTGLIIEVGEVSVDQNWSKVSFDRTFTEPVVVAGPPSANDSDPALVLIRNVTSESFEIRLKEWAYQDGQHAFEQVSYVVVEKGSMILESGARVEAGYFNATHNVVTVNFQSSFAAVPVVLTTISSENETSPVTGRMQNVAKDSFQYSLQEEEGSVNKSHGSEKIAYLAWEPGKGTENGMVYEVSVTDDNIKHKWKTLNMQNDFTSLPFMVADMQTKDGADPASIRQKDITLNEVDVRVEEERSATSETKHTSEVVGMLIIGSELPQEESLPGISEENQRVTFSWTFDSNQEDSIIGFNFYANGELVCEAGNPAARTITCEIPLSNQVHQFTMTSIGSNSEETSMSNSIDYQH